MNNLLAYATTRKQTRNQLLETWLAEGCIEVLDGVRRVSPETPVGNQQILVTFTLADPPGESTDGVFVGELPDPAMVVASGEPTWAIVKDSAGNVVFDCDVGGDGSGAVIQLANPNLIAGGLVSLTQFQLSEG